MNTVSFLKAMLKVNPEIIFANQIKKAEELFKKDAVKPEISKAKQLEKTINKF